MAEIDKLRAKFRARAAELYPNAQYPEMCWLFDQVLGIDVRTVAAEPISKKHYITFIMDGNGNIILDPKKEYHRLKVVRKFTPQQGKIVREWWPLLPESLKIA